MHKWYTMLTYDWQKKKKKSNKQSTITKNHTWQKENEVKSV